MLPTVSGVLADSQELIDHEHLIHSPLDNGGNTMAQRKRLSNVTWTLGDKPCKTLRISAGCWVDQEKSKSGKVGKQHSSLVRFGHTNASR